MLATLYRSNRPAVLVGVPLLVLALFAGSTIRPHSAGLDAMPFQDLLRAFLGIASWMPGVLGMLLVMLISVQLSGLANNADLLGRRNHLPALLFPLLLATIGRTGPLEPMHVGAALAGMPLVLAALSRTLSVANGGRVLGQLFDSGVLLGCAALFYLPYVFLLVVVWASVSVIRPFHWREYVLPSLGCITVFYLGWAVVLLVGGEWSPLFTVAQFGATVPAPSIVWTILFNTVMLLLLLAAIARFAGNYQRGVMREKNLRSSFMAFMAGLAVIIGFTKILNGDFPSVLMAAPLAVFVSHALLGQRRAWLSELAVYALLMLALWAQWG